MKNRLVFGAATTLLLLAISLIAAQGAESHAIDPEAIARDYLSGRSVAGGGPDDLELVGMSESRGAYHVRLQQSLGGIPIFGASATVSIAKESADVTFALDRRTPATPAAPAGVTFGANAAIGRATEGVGITALRGRATASPVYYPLDGALVLAWEVEAPALEPLGDWQVIVRADTGAVLLRRNLLRFDSGQVFDPNPVVTSGGAVPPPRDCDSAGAEAGVAAQYQSRTLLGIESGQGKLRGTYVDLTAPGLGGSNRPPGQADEASHVYVYPCNDDRFEEVMVYYHVDAVQRKLQTLGFTGQQSILNRRVRAHAHYNVRGVEDSTTCNAFYSSFTVSLHFGDGGAACEGDDGNATLTDFAEDADIIVHEYGHAIQDDQVPGWGDTGEYLPQQTLAMGEGFSDFLAAAVAGDPCIGEWANIGRHACGGQPGIRSLDNDATFPEIFGDCEDDEDRPGVEDEHCTSLVWSGALWDIVEALGGDQAARDLVLTLVIDSHYYLDGSANFAEAVAAVEAADQDVFGGANATILDDAFAARGLGPVATGNANCAGAVDAVDALVVLQFEAELLFALPCVDEADADLDGTIGSIDSALILQFGAGLIDEL